MVQIDVETPDGKKRVEIPENEGLTVEVEDTQPLGLGYSFDKKRVEIPAEHFKKENQKN